MVCGSVVGGAAAAELRTPANIKPVKQSMAIGYREMAEINLQLSEVCFAAESEVEKLFKADSGE